jgi:hypothetical protein
MKEKFSKKMGVKAYQIKKAKYLKTAGGKDYVNMTDQ